MNLIENEDCLVSVVIPAYNAQGFVREAIDSALSQDYSNVEVLVVDDGSDVELATTLADCRSRISLIRCERGGPARARNIGVAAASGEFIQFLDADDYLLPQKIRLCVEHLREGFIPFTLKQHVKEPDWAMSRYEVQSLTPAQPCPGPDSGIGDLVLPLAYPIGTEAPLHRRDVLISMGGFNEELWNCEDVELHFRLATQGYRFDCIQRVGVLVRTGQTGVRLRQSRQRNLMGIRATREMMLNLPDAEPGYARARALLGDRLAYYGGKSILQGFVKQGVEAIKQAHQLTPHPRPSRRPVWNLLFRVVSLRGLAGSRRVGDSEVRSR